MSSKRTKREREIEAENLYEDFFGKEPGEEFDIELGKMDVLTFLGPVHAIEYFAEKKHLGDKRPELYRHEFDKMPVLLTNGNDLIIFGKSVRITKRGIEG